MKINFTKKQYKQLLDLVYLGEWTANASRNKDERIQEYEEIMQYVLSFAKNFGYDDIVDYDKSMDSYFPNREHEEEMDIHIDHNENVAFWHQLSRRLANRDVEKEGIQDPEERLKRVFELEAKYEDEFVENGIENISIKK